MSSAVALPDIDEEIREGEETSEQTEPLYHVILLDDNDHTYDYVVEMLSEQPPPPRRWLQGLSIGN